MPFKDLSSCFCVSAVVLLAVQLLPPCTYALQCKCTDCVHEKTSLPVNTCETAGACFVQDLRLEDIQTKIYRGCISEDHVTEKCNSKSNSRIVCCYDDQCNNEDKRELRALSEGNGTGATDRNGENNSSPNSSKFRTAAIITSTVCIFFMTIVMSLVLSVSYWYCCRRHRNRIQRRDVESGQSESRISCNGPHLCEAIIPQSETIPVLLQASSLSLLVQRRIIRQTMLEKSIEKRHRHELFVGTWRKQKVMVKVYPPKHEMFYFTETEFYQIPNIRHENILSFLAADVVQRNSQICYYLILQFHDRGTLYDYLQTTVLDVYSMIPLAHSVANGLAYLHSEMSDERGGKPAVAHRNLNSKGIFVKADGMCCIGDFSLAVKNGSNIEAELQNRPVVRFRYHAPECLEGSMVQKDIDSLRKADMYSCGLVLWEIARRCAIQGMVEDVVLPYSDATSSDPPSLEEMREIVCERQRRPPIPDQWNRDESMRVILRMVTECWHQNSTVRLTALRVRKSLEKLCASVKPFYDKNGKLTVIEIDRSQFHS